MRHQRQRYQLSRSASHRKALLINLAKEVIDHERIQTTEAKAKAVKPEVERALGVLLGDSSVSVTVAGRTDTGVHALGQVSSYLGSPAPVEGLNALLPDDVAVLACEPAVDGFDARRDATSRAYTYLVLNRPARTALQRGRALHWPRTVDRPALEACAAALVGTHDFTAFTPTETEHVRFSRDVYAAYWRFSGDGERAEF